MNQRFLFSYLRETFSLMEAAFSYQKVFDGLGISDLLGEKFIKVEELDKQYIDYFYNSIKKFIKQPLFKDLNLSDEDDLKYLRDNDIFQDYFEEIIQKLDKKLSPQKDKVTKYIKNYPSKKEISLDEISKAVKLDNNSLLFILDNLKEDKDIYDFNGREVTLN